MSIMYKAKWLTSHRSAKTTFTFHFSIITAYESIWQCWKIKFWKFILPKLILAFCNIFLGIPHLGTRSEKNGIIWEKLPSGEPPPPKLGKPLLSKKKVRFIFHLRSSGTFLVFTKISPFWVIDWNYVVGIGEPPLRDARFLHFPKKENIVKC